MTATLLSKLVHRASLDRLIGFFGNYSSTCSFFGNHLIRFRPVTPHVPEPHLSAWRALLNSHASVVARVEEALADAELPPLAWYDVLWAVRRAPGRRIRMAELADSLTLSRGGLSKLADRLEAAGLIARERAQDDGRGLFAVLTDDGDAMLRRMWPVYSRILGSTIVETLTPAEAVVVAAALTRVNETAERGAGVATRVR
jgi:DNA-binding MarR family transcriptional regulator